MRPCSFMRPRHDHGSRASGSAGPAGASTGRPGIRQEGDRETEGWLCFPAAALARVALDRGLDVAVDPRHRRSDLKRRAVFSEPHGGGETDLDVDLVPLDLLRQARSRAAVSAGRTGPSRRPGAPRSPPTPRVAIPSAAAPP